MAIIPKQLKGLPGFVLGLFLLLTLVGVAMFGLAKLIHGVPK
jgi:CHASE3 domain sensor protein